jgi:arylsulfatase
MRDPASPRHGDFAVPHVLDGVRKMTYTTAHTRMVESSVLNLKNCSYRIVGDIEIVAGDHGVIACQGGNMAGWSMYLSEASVPVFHYNWYGHVHTSVKASEALQPGQHVIEATFDYDGGFGAGGLLTLIVDGTPQAMARIEATVPLVFSMSGETFDVGVDTGSPVGPYPHQFEFTGFIRGVTLEQLDERSVETEKLMRQGLFKASLSSQ